MQPGTQWWSIVDAVADAVMDELASGGKILTFSRQDPTRLGIYD